MLCRERGESRGERQLGGINGAGGKANKKKAKSKPAPLKTHRGCGTRRSILADEPYIRQGVSDRDNCQMEWDSMGRTGGGGAAPCGAGAGSADASCKSS